MHGGMRFFSSRMTLLMRRDSASENRIALLVLVIMGVRGVLVGGCSVSFGVLLGEGVSLGEGGLLGEGGSLGVVRLLLGDWFVVVVSVGSVAVVMWVVCCSGRADLRNELMAHCLEVQFR